MNPVLLVAVMLSLGMLASLLVRSGSSRTSWARILRGRRRRRAFPHPLSL